MKTDSPKPTPRRTLHLPFPRHNRTAFIQIDTSQCAACGQCIAACPREVLGMITFFRHRHVHVDQAGECKGCRKCIATCPHGAIEPRLVAQKRVRLY